MPPTLHNVGTDAQNSFEDLSGVCTPKLRNGKNMTAAIPLTPDSTGSSTKFPVVKVEVDPVEENPYDILIEACESNPASISKGYSNHRTSRNAKFSAQLKSPGCLVPTVDRTLVAVQAAKAEGRPVDDSVDPRNCLVFWARPPERIRKFVKSVQDELKQLAPEGLWLMPEDCLHMTVLELTHSVSPEEVQRLIDIISPSIENILQHTLDHRAKVVRPLISFDSAALAISFIPSPEEEYTYHHLRRDLYALCRDAGVTVESRYVLPSAHITLGRFTDDAPMRGRMAEWVEGIERINERLARDCADVSWVVGEEKGLDFRKGRLWYGGGETYMIGEGF